MGSRMESCRFELTTHVGERLSRLRGQRHRFARDHAIDVEHAEPDPLHVEGADRDTQGGAFIEERFLRLALGLCLHACDEVLEALFGGFSRVGGCHKDGDEPCIKMVI